MSVSFLRIICVLTFILFFSFSYVFSQQAIEGTVVFGSDDNYPPYEFLDNDGNPVGFNIDLIREIAKEMGFEVAIKLGVWEEIRKELEVDGSVHISDMFYSVTRDKVVDYAIPHEVMYDEIYIRTGQKGILDFNDLIGKRVSVQGASSLEDHLKMNFPGINVVPVKSEPDALLFLSKGECDAAIVSQTTGKGAIKNLKLNNIIYIGRPVLPREYSFVVREGNHELLRILNIGLARVKESGKFAELKEKWFEKDASGAWMIYILALVLISLLILVWNWKLRKIIKTITSQYVNKFIQVEKQQLRETEEALRYQKVLFELAKMDKSDFEKSLKVLLRSAAETLNVERASYWKISDSNNSIICQQLFIKSKNSFDETPTLLRRELYSTYFENIRSVDKIVANDAINDSKTREFAETYLKPLGITSMLDVPVWSRGILVGIICHEHIGEIRTWNLREQNFCTTIAEMISASLEASEHKQTEQKLEESEQRYRKIVEISPDAIVIHSDGKIVYANPATVKLSGAASLNDLIGRFAIDFVHPDDRELVLNRIRKLMESGIPVPAAEERFIKFDGSIIHTEVIATPMNFQGKLAVQVIIRDISERKLIYQSIKELKDRLNYYLEVSPVVTYALGIDGNKLKRKWASPNIERILGFSLEESLKPNWWIENIYAPDRQKAIIETSTIFEKKSLRLEYRFVCKDGKIISVLDELRLIHDENGNPTEVVGAWTDITKIKQIENSLKQSEQFLTDVFESIQDGITVLDKDLTIIRANEITKRQYSNHLNLEGKKCYEAFHNLIQPCNNCPAIRSLETGKLEHEIVSGPSGSSVEFVELFSYPMRDSITGEFTGIIEFGRNITQRKLAENALRDSEERYRKLFEVESDAIALIENETGRILDVNTTMCSLYGYSRDELLKMKNTDISAQPDETRKATTNGATIIPVRYHKKKDGTLFPVEITGSHFELDGKKVQLAAIRDITARVKTEKEIYLLQSLSLAINNAPDFKSALEISLEKVCNATDWVYGEAWAPSNDGNYLEYSCSYTSLEDINQLMEIVKNKKFEKGVGVAGKTWSTMKPFWVKDINYFYNFTRGKIIVEMGLKAAMGFPIIAGDDVVAVICFFVTEAREEDEKLINLVSTVASQLSNVFEKKRAEEKIKESEQKYRTIFEESKDVIYIGKPDGKLIDMNPAGVELFGYESKEELLNTNLSKLYMNPDDRIEYVRALNEKGVVKNWEIKAKKKNGDEIILLATATSEKDKEGNIIAYRGVLRDVTEQRKLQQQLMQVQKLESLGTLASGIAHDFNNILGIIIGHADLLEKLHPEIDSIKKNAKAISDSGFRGAQLVKQMLTFARKVDVKFEAVQINEIINEVTKLLKETFPKTIIISLELENEIQKIIADSTQLHQVLLNLCVNARDAMGNIGTLTITTKLLSAKKIKRQFPKAIKSEYISVSVEDTGIGMDEATRLHIFEPFFTTKEVGKGTGLGLSVVFGIIEAHNGFIEVNSELGKGTIFNIYLPVSDIKELEKQNLEVTQEISFGNETILLVEDEEMLKELMQNILESKGYKVLVASDGKEALKIYDQQQQDIQLILSDFGLPQLNGYEVYQKLRNINPNVKFILASGYIEPDLKTKFLKDGINYCIEKPYNAEKILQAIRDILDRV